jgi:hypothetical protein
MLVLGVPAESIRELGESWSDGSLWDDIIWLATLARASGNETERRMRWHHLVMAVGNFKRQSGRRLRPSSVSPAASPALVARTDEFRGPEGLTIGADDRSTWQGLENSLKGAATATTTTILAALWPERHHILDWRVLAAVTGLSIAVGGDDDLVLVTPESREKLQPNLDHYAQVRPVLIRLAGEAVLPLVTVERALYIMSTSVRGTGMTWAQYGRELVNAVPKSGDKGDDGALDDEQDLLPSAP